MNSAAVFEAAVLEVGRRKQVRVVAIAADVEVLQREAHSCPLGSTAARSPRTMSRRCVPGVTCHLAALLDVMEFTLRSVTGVSRA
ncbi:MAG: hypothetical protein CMJ85_03655 [Planctomycetes bacterium]|nr:hypothetical protein [Planctomycetota bacterium]